MTAESEGSRLRCVPGGRENVAYVVEVHDRWACSQCGARGWHKAIWVNAWWVSGADPLGSPTLVICDDCWRSAEVGALVSPLLGTAT